MKELVNKAQHFIEHDIWYNGANGGFFRRFLYACCRLLYLTLQGFMGDQCLIRSTALAYTTILSLVPLLAVAFSISKGFGLQNSDFIRDFLLRVTAGRTEIVDYILTYINNTNVKALGWIGVAALLATVFSMFSNVERAFNVIWNNAPGRSVWRRFTDFFSVMLICPILFLAAASVSLTVQQTPVVQYLLAIQGVGFLLATLLKLTPFIVLVLAFVFMYAYIPNTKVRFLSALIGGAVAAFMWQSAQWAYINWQIGFKKYNAIYGSFAQLPLFLVWMYISWTILLFGAEICYAWQHLNTFTRKRTLEAYSALEQQQSGVLLMVLLARCFYTKGGSVGVDALAEQAGMPSEIVGRQLGTLQHAGLVLPVENSEKDELEYVVAKDPASVSLVAILQHMTDPAQEGGLTFPETFSFLEERLSGIYASAGESPDNITLQMLAEAAPAAECI